MSWGVRFGRLDHGFHSPEIVLGLEFASSRCSSISAAARIVYTLRNVEKVLEAACITGSIRQNAGLPVGPTFGWCIKKL